VNGKIIHTPHTFTTRDHVLEARARLRIPYRFVAESWDSGA